MRCDVTQAELTGIVHAVGVDGAPEVRGVQFALHGPDGSGVTFWVDNVYMARNLAATFRAGVELLDDEFPDEDNE